MDKQYSELVKGRIYFGGAADAKAAVENEAVELVVDLRVNGLSAEQHQEIGAPYIHKPIEEELGGAVIAQSIKAGVQQVVAAFEEGKKVYFHCGGGGGRAGVMAVATLLELGLADSLENAEEQVVATRSAVNIRPNMKSALEQLYK